VSGFVCGFCFKEISKDGRAQYGKTGRNYPSHEVFLENQASGDMLPKLRVAGSNPVARSGGK
jgi:hypothetical protein